MHRKTDSNNPADWLYISQHDMEGIVALAKKTHDLQALAEELEARRSDLFALFKPFATKYAEVYFVDRYLANLWQSLS